MTVASAARERAAELWQLARSRVARDASWLLAGQAVRVVAQAAGFVLLARTLGPADLGTFAAIGGVATLLSPFVHLGAYSLAIRDVVDGVPESRVTGNYLALTAFTLPAALVALVCIGLFAVPIAPVVTVLAVGVGTLLGARLTSLFRGISVARGEVWASGIVEGSVGMVYVCGALMLNALHGTFRTWAWIFCANNLLVGFAVVVVLVARFGRPTSTFENVWRRLTDGVHFGIGHLAENANSELDKTVLLRLSSPENAGLYAASHRAVAVAIVPAMAFFGAIYRKFFHAGQKGLAASHAMAMRIAPLAMAYGLAMWMVLSVGSPVVAKLFGKHFAESASVVRWLAPMVMLQVVSTPFLDAITGARLQPLRAGAQVAALCVGLTINVLLDPHIGWKGAAIASISSQAALLAFAAIGAPWLEKRSAARRTLAAIE